MSVPDGGYPPSGLLGVPGPGLVPDRVTLLLPPEWSVGLRIVRCDGGSVLRCLFVGLPSNPRRSITHPGCRGRVQVPLPKSRQRRGTVGTGHGHHVHRDVPSTLLSKVAMYRRPECGTNARNPDQDFRSGSSLPLLCEVRGGRPRPKSPLPQKKPPIQADFVCGQDSGPGWEVDDASLKGDRLHLAYSAGVSPCKILTNRNKR